MNWIAHDCCPMCGGEDVVVSGKGIAPVVQHPDILGGVPMAALTSFVQCADCGLEFQNPHLTRESMDEFYASGEYRKYTAVQTSRDDEYEMERQQRIIKIVPNKGSFLDIGCGRGYLVQLARVRGCSPVLGVDLDAKRVEKDVPFTTNLASVSGAWDTITCIHNLEHVFDLKETAGHIMRLLAPGGMLIVEVPGPKSHGGPYTLYHTYVIPPWVMLKLFAPLKRELFEVNPHHLHVFRKAAA